MKDEEQKKEKEESGIHIDLGFGKLFKGIGNFIDLVGQMTEKGEEFVEKTKEFHGEGALKDLKGIYGFSVKVGLGGKPTVEPFGNVKSTPKGPVVDEAREPIVDIFEEENEIQILAEMPGVEEQDVELEINGDILILSAAGSDRKYHKELLLPSQVEPEALSRSHKNGIFEARFKKK
ncbi:Hsp20/alpha crystallin family protein [bacterium]|nr:Hsp20/alpha crystallin family protein [bacterium]MBU1065638.1 Hsp20/alpha crystallin family protein [bacterium]MBU1635571.1 Hsp20/alpha crystallin family protein [bacterium]MBU1875337.1 Hsp20/alpha crystallin family protein [bacterium]